MNLYTTSLGANYSGVTVHAYCCCMIDKDHNRWTGTAVGRSVVISRSNCTDANYDAQIPCMKFICKLFDDRKKISDWPKSGQVKTGPT